MPFVLFCGNPAWWASRVNLTDKLKESSRNDGGKVTQRLRSALVVAEVTMAAAVLVGAGLLVSMLARLRAVPLYQSIVLKLTNRPFPAPDLPGVQPRLILRWHYELSKAPTD